MAESGRRMKVFPKLKTSCFEAWIADNRAVNNHAPGYNGIAALVPPSNNGISVFHPNLCGMNYECTWFEGVEQTREQSFEPRTAPIAIERAGEDSVTLYQPPTPDKGIETRIVLRAEEPFFLHQHISLRMHKTDFGRIRLNTLWASYLFSPRDICLYSRSSLPGSYLDHWMGLTKMKHGERQLYGVPLPASEISALEHRKLSRQARFRPVTLGEGLSFYYGLYFDDLFLMMFQEPDSTSLAYSPSGAGKGMPAWDYQLHAELEPLEWVRWNVCLVYKPFESRKEVLELVSAYQGNRRESARDQKPLSAAAGLAG